MEKKPTPRAVALLPVAVFLVLYLVLGIILEYVLKIKMGFYQIPIVVAFLAAILVACLQNRALSFDEKLTLMGRGVGDKNIITMLLIFLAAGMFVGVVGRSSAESVAYFMLSIIPSKFAVAVLFVVSCFVSTAMGTSVGTITLIVPIAIPIAAASGYSLPLCVASVMGGAMFGDNLSFISDTTIAACNTQGCEMKDKFRTNFRIALPAALVTLALLWFAGASGQVVKHEEYQFIRVVPYLAILVMALAGVNVFIVLLAIFGPGMNSYTYSGQDLSQKNFAPRVPGIEQFGILDGSEKMSTTTGTKIVNNYVEKGKDDVYYWFGSDLYGRDIWTRTWEGARVSLIIAVAAAAIIDMVIGMSYGLISGYFGGKVDMLMQRFLEVANGIPRLVIVTLLLLVLQPGMITIIFALMLTEWVGMSRIARAEMLKLKDQEFVLASRTLGAGSFFIIFKEVLPNIIGPIITQVMFSIPTAIFTEAFLSFVGLGIPVPQCSLGSLISELYNSFTTHPYQIIPPIVVMSLLMLSFNLVADGLREALDPKMKSM